MSRNCIILISGFPGTGKTTLGEKLSASFKFPFITKDAFKERIFDTLGWSDKAWSHKVSAASHRIMDYFIEEELKVGGSLIIESNFKPDIDSVRFGEFQDHYGCAIVQILCWADGEVVYQRYMDRRKTAGRHPGHVEGIGPEEIRAQLIRGKAEPIKVNGPTIELDTTDFAQVDYQKLIREVAVAVA